MTATAIDPQHYQAFRAFLERSCGIVLGENKQYLVASRLGPVLARYGMADLGELMSRLEAPGATPLRAQVIEAMTTNETQFFRDIYPFEMLRKQIFPELARRRGGMLRIWSAGCSSGQEAYSISMTIAEYNQMGGGLSAEIIGTDISGEMIRQAQAGRYSAAAIGRGLSPERLQRFFTQPEPDVWEVRSEIRRGVSFRQHNLLESFVLLGRFDIIFCRNVLIYFSQAARRDILQRMAAQLQPGGYLIVGGSESLTRQVDCFEMVRGSGGVVYRLKAAQKD